jgi:uncharacterized protein (DUF885 family)
MKIIQFLPHYFVTASTRFFIAMLVCSLSLPSPALSAPAAAADAAFQQYANRTLIDMWRQFPEQGVGVGYYKHVQEMTVPDDASRARAVAFYDRQLAALAKFDPNRLSAPNRVDLILMRNQFESSRWDVTTFKSWQWQPSQYNVGNDFGLLLNTEYAPLETRLRHVMARLAKVPAYYAAAKVSISNPTVEHTRLAIVQNEGTLLSVFGQQVLATAWGSKLSAPEKKLFRARLEKAALATNDFISYLIEVNEELITDPASARNFRIGRELYAQKFAYDIQSGFSMDELHKRAIAEKASLHDAMEKRARSLWPKYMVAKEMPSDRLILIRAMIDELATRHAKREAFVETVRKQIPALEAFVRDKDLLDQDRTRPLVVREMPRYMRGDGAGASVSAAGPYDPKANTYYNVTPLDEMPDAEAASELRESTIGLYRY